jgi:hypothetical protein
MSDIHDEPGSEPGGLSRRQIIKRIGVGTAVVWATPAITSLGARAYAATDGGSPAPHPECIGANCSTFIPCSSSNTDCVCVTTPQGGFCIPGSTLCSTLEVCAAGNICPPGSVCAIDTCCVNPVCVPIILVDRCPPGGTPASSSVRVSTGPGTLGG